MEVEVQAGNQSHANHSLPGLIALLKRLPADSKPEFVRGDIGYGTDNIMTEMEAINQRYLFKLKKSNTVKKLINRQHCLGEWFYINKAWEAKEEDGHNPHPWQYREVKTGLCSFASSI